MPQAAQAAQAASRGCTAASRELNATWPRAPAALARSRQRALTAHGRDNAQLDMPARSLTCVRPLHWLLCRASPAAGASALCCPARAENPSLLRPSMAAAGSGQSAAVGGGVGAEAQGACAIVASTRTPVAHSRYIDYMANFTPSARSAAPRGPPSCWRARERQCSTQSPPRPADHQHCRRPLPSSLGRCR